MFYRVLFFLSTIVLLTGCKKEKVETIPEITIDLNKVSKINIDSITLVDISYIFLETTKNNLIGSIDKFLYFNNKLFILDKSITHTIYCFDISGKFIYKIDKRGKGPGEYININDFYVNENEEVSVYDGMRKRIIVYSNNGNSYTEIKLNYSFEEIVPLNDNEVLVRNLYSEGENIAAIAKINISNMKCKYIIGARKIYDDLEIPNYCNHYIYKSGKKIYFNPRFTNDIICFDSNRIQTKISIENESLFPDPGYVNSLKDDPLIVFKTDNFISDIRNIYESNEYIVFNILKGITWIGIYDKIHKQFGLVNSLKSINYFGRPEFIGVYKDIFFSISHSDLKGVADILGKSSLPQEVKNAIENHPVDSNPIIISYKIKINYD